MIQTLELNNGVEVEVIYNYTPAIISQDYDMPSYSAEVDIVKVTASEGEEISADDLIEIETRLYELNEKD